MSASDHLNKKQFEVFRGVELVKRGRPESKPAPRDWDEKAMGSWDEHQAMEHHNSISLSGHSVRQPLGVHWSSEHAVAKDFATHQGLADYRSHIGTPGVGAVIHATVKKGAVHPMKTAEDHEDYGIAADQDEGEIPLKRGAKVAVHSITTYRGSDSEKSRTRRYKSPRTMHA